MILRFLDRHLWHRLQDRYDLAAVILPVIGMGVLAALGLMHSLNDVLGPAPAAAAMAVVVVTIYLAALFKADPIFVLLFFLFIFGQFGALLSGAIIEGGADVIEQRRMGYPTGGTVRLSMYTVGFLLVAQWATRVLGVLRIHAKAQKDSHWRLPSLARLSVYGALAGVLLVLFAGIAVNGSPLLLGEDRFWYWENNQFPLIRPIHNQLSTLVFLTGLVLVSARSTKERATAISLFALSLAYIVFQGEKFSGLMLIAYSFALPPLLHALARKALRPALRWMLGVGLVLVLGVTGLILYQYATVYDSADPVLDLANRIALQGHVWWGIDERAVSGSTPVPFTAQANREAAALLDVVEHTEQPVGMRFLMRELAPASLVDMYERRGIRFTMGYPAIGLVILGYAGLAIAQAFAALLLALVVGYLRNGILQFGAVQAVIGYKLLFEMTSVFLTGDLHLLISWKTLLYLGMAATWWLLGMATSSWHGAPTRGARLT